MMMSDQIDWDFAGDGDARAEIGAAVRYLLKDATGSARDAIVREIIKSVHDVANTLPPPQRQIDRTPTQPSNLPSAALPIRPT